MAKITDYSKVTELTNDNVFLLDGQNGTKGILAIDLADGLNGFLSATDLTDGKDFNELGVGGIRYDGYIPIIQPDTGDGNTLYRISIDDLVFKIIDKYADMPTRRNTWRGKNLGTAVTTEQYNQIKAGTFEDLFLGDYWLINDITWRIVDFDYWITTYNNTKHHLVIMPDKPLANWRMNTTNTTEGGFGKSALYADLQRSLEGYPLRILYNSFGNMHNTSIRDYVSNAVTNGYPSGVANVASPLILPSEIMIYGCNIFAPSGDGTITPANNTINVMQLAGMRINPELINTGTVYWFRDVISATGFAVVNHGGVATYDHASNVIGVRPAFALVG